MLKSLAIAAMELTGLSHVLTPVYAGRGVIFTGHRVLHDDQPTLIPGNAITESQLERMLKCIRRSGWEIVPIESVPLLLADKEKPRFACITLDDGFADNWNIATPVLRAATAPFSVFPVVGYIERQLVPNQELLEWLILRTDRLELRVSENVHIQEDTRTPEEKQAAFAKAMSLVWRNVPGLSEALASASRRIGLSVDDFMDETFLSWDQLRLLAHTPGVTIGTHSISHRPLASLEKQQAYEELLKPRELLHEALGVPINCTAYPYGSAKECGQREYDLAREAGYKIGFSTRPGNIYHDHSNELLSLPRVTISMVPHASSDRFIRTSLRGTRNAAMNRLRRKVA
jgi:peptidoglycan/xylan/chitin deacetylase (PgdA/CDA1 family)